MPELTLIGTASGSCLVLSRRGWRMPASSTEVLPSRPNG